MAVTRLLPAARVPPSPVTSPMPGPSALPASMSIGDLTFAVRQSERRRTVGITVDRDGSLLLHAPAGISADALAAWAWSKRGWVFRKLAEKHLLLPASPVRSSSPGKALTTSAATIVSS